MAAQQTQTDPAVVARAAVGDRATCQVCGHSVPLRKDGIPTGTHKWTVVHNPDADPEHHVVTVSDCPGSNLPPLEFARAFDAARLNRG